MTIPTFQAAGTISQSATAGVTIQPPWPAHQSGDIALLLVEFEDHQGYPGSNYSYFVDDAGFRPVAGATPTFSGTQGSGGAVPLPADTASAHLAVFWCRATNSAMPSPTIASGGDHRRACILTFRGCAATGYPIDVAASKRYDMTPATAKTFPSVTTTGTDRLIVNIAGTSGGHAFSSWANASLAAPAITEALDSDNSTLGNGSGFGVAYGGLAAAGASGGSTVNISFNSVIAMMTLALRPDAGVNTDKDPFVQAIGEIFSGTSGNLTIAWPPHAVDDLGILVVVSNGFPINALVTSAGFSEISGSRQASGTSGSNFNGNSMVAYQCRATSTSMSSPVVGVQGLGTRAFIFTVRNAGGIDAVASGGTGAGAAITSYSIPGLTTNKDRELIVDLATDVHGVNYCSANNDWANTSLADMVPAVLDAQGNTLALGIIMGHGRKLVAGAVNATTFTLFTPSRNCTLKLAFKPKDKVLIADKGTFNLTGNAARILRHLRLVAAKGSFNLTGNASNLSAIFHHIVIRAETGVFTCTPQDAIIKRQIGGGWEKELEAKGSDWTKETPLED